MQGGCGNLENAGCVATSCVGVSPADETSSRVSAVTATLVRFLSAQFALPGQGWGSAGAGLGCGLAGCGLLVVTAVSAAHARGRPAGQTRKVGSVP